MSTRRTLWHNDDLHLFLDGFDNENVYLEIHAQFFENLVLKIPLSAWKEMRKHTIQPEESYMDFTDEELRREAEKEVDAHREELASRLSSGLGGLFGSFVFGLPNLSRDEMIEHFLKTYRPELVSRAKTEGDAS